MNMIITKQLHAAFCGTGKSYLCNNFPDTYKEVECWRYEGDNFPDNYISDIVLKTIGVKYLFICTNPIVLKRVHSLGYKVYLYYPKNELKEEYFIRYVGRGSCPDFIKMLSKYWDKWVNELKEQNYCSHVILGKGEYLQDIFCKKFWERIKGVYYAVKELNGCITKNT